MVLGIVIIDGTWDGARLWIVQTHIYTIVKIKQIVWVLPIQEVVLLFCGNGVEMVIITLNESLKDSAVFCYHWVQMILGAININSAITQNNKWCNCCGARLKSSLAITNNVHEKKTNNSSRDHSICHKNTTHWLLKYVKSTNVFLGSFAESGPCAPKSTTMTPPSGSTTVPPTLRTSPSTAMISLVQSEVNLALSGSELTGWKYGKGRWNRDD